MPFIIKRIIRFLDEQLFHIPFKGVSAAAKTRLAWDDLMTGWEFILLRSLACPAELLLKDILIHPLLEHMISILFECRELDAGMDGEIAPNERMYTGVISTYTTLLSKILTIPAYLQHLTTPAWQEIMSYCITFIESEIEREKEEECATIRPSGNFSSVMRTISLLLSAIPTSTIHLASTVQRHLQFFDRLLSCSYLHCQEYAFLLHGVTQYVMIVRPNHQSFIEEFIQETLSKSTSLLNFLDSRLVEVRQSAVFMCRVFLEFLSPLDATSMETATFQAVWKCLRVCLKWISDYRSFVPLEYPNLYIMAGGNLCLSLWDETSGSVSADLSRGPRSFALLDLAARCLNFLSGTPEERGVSVSCDNLGNLTCEYSSTDNGTSLPPSTCPSPMNNQRSCKRRLLSIEPLHIILPSNPVTALPILQLLCLVFCRFQDTILLQGIANRLATTLLDAEESFASEYRGFAHWALVALTIYLESALIPVGGQSMALQTLNSVLNVDMVLLCAKIIQFTIREPVLHEACCHFLSVMVSTDLWPELEASVCAFSNRNAFNPSVIYLFSCMASKSSCRDMALKWMMNMNDQNESAKIPTISLLNHLFFSLFHDHAHEGMPSYMQSIKSVNQFWAFKSALFHRQCPLNNELSMSSISFRDVEIDCLPDLDARQEFYLQRFATENEMHWGFHLPSFFELVIPNFNIYLSFSMTSDFKAAMNRLIRGPSSEITVDNISRLISLLYLGVLSKQDTLKSWLRKQPLDAHFAYIGQKHVEFFRLLTYLREFSLDDALDIHLATNSNDTVLNDHTQKKSVDVSCKMFYPVYPASSNLVTMVELCQAFPTAMKKIMEPDNFSDYGVWILMVIYNLHLDCLPRGFSRLDLLEPLGHALSLYSNEKDIMLGRLVVTLLKLVLTSAKSALMSANQLEHMCTVFEPFVKYFKTVENPVVRRLFVSLLCDFLTVDGAYLSTFNVPALLLEFVSDPCKSVRLAVVYHMGGLSSRIKNTQNLDNLSLGMLESDVMEFLVLRDVIGNTDKTGWHFNVQYLVENSPRPTLVASVLLRLYDTLGFPKVSAMLDSLMEFSSIMMYSDSVAGRELPLAKYQVVFESLGMSGTSFRKRYIKCLLLPCFINTDKDACLQILASVSKPALFKTLLLSNLPFILAVLTCKARCTLAELLESCLNLGFIDLDQPTSGAEPWVSLWSIIYPDTICEFAKLSLYLDYDLAALSLTLASVPSEITEISACLSLCQDIYSAHNLGKLWHFVVQFIRLRTLQVISNEHFLLRLSLIHILRRFLLDSKLSDVTLELVRIIWDNACTMDDLSQLANLLSRERNDKENEEVVQLCRSVLGLEIDEHNLIDERSVRKSTSKIPIKSAAQKSDGLVEIQTEFANQLFGLLLRDVGLECLDAAIFVCSQVSTLPRYCHAHIHSMLESFKTIQTIPTSHLNSRRRPVLAFDWGMCCPDFIPKLVAYLIDHFPFQNASGGEPSLPVLCKGVCQYKPLAECLFSSLICWIIYEEKSCGIEATWKNWISSGVRTFFSNVSHPDDLKLFMLESVEKTCTLFMRFDGYATLYTALDLDYSDLAKVSLSLESSSSLAWYEIHQKQSGLLRLDDAILQDIYQSLNIQIYDQPIFSEQKFSITHNLWDNVMWIGGLNTLGHWDTHASADAHLDVLKSFMNRAAYPLALTYFKGCSAENGAYSAEILDIYYEACWRTCQWDLNNTSHTLPWRQSVSQLTSVPYKLYKALESVAGISEEEFSVDFLEQVWNDIVNAAEESASSITMVLERPNDISSALVESLVSIKQVDASNVSSMSSVLDYIERCVTTHSCLPHSTLWGAVDSLLEALTTLTSRSANMSRDVQFTASLRDFHFRHLLRHGHYLLRRPDACYFAQREFFLLGHMADSYKFNEFDEKFELFRVQCVQQSTFGLAHVYWKKNEPRLAMDTMERLIAEIATQPDTMLANRHLMIEGLMNLGDWKRLTKSHPPGFIISNYYEKALESAGEGENSNDLTRILLVDAHYALAQYSYEEHRRQMSQENSNRAQFEELLKWNKENLKSVKRLYALQHEKDNIEFSENESHSMNLLHASLYNFLRSLMLSDKHQLSIFRYLSLWFSHEDDRHMCKTVLAFMSRIPSSKFVPAVNQLSAKLDSSESAFQTVVGRLLVAVASDHPHHAIYPLISLENVDCTTLTTTVKSGSKRGLSAPHQSGVLKAKGVAANAVLCKVMKTSESHSGLVGSMRLAAKAYAQIAYLQVDDGCKSGEMHSLDTRLLLLRHMDQFQQLVVMTADLDIRKSADYSDLLISSFKPKFWMPGGIHAPKVITCIASNGVEYTQLVKGNEDLRQDHIILSLFSNFNTLLLEKDLKISTYKVIPLSPLHGVVQWVPDTVPLGTWLVDAHNRPIHKNEWTPLKARKAMTTEHASKKSSPSSKLELFRTIQQNFHPVLSYFFFERFDLSGWLEARRCYTKSLAVHSIAGFVIGLGDRHAQNTLLHLNTGALIPIDLGIAFDQGMLLSTPELVPFRLTAECVDGLGLPGLGGPFLHYMRETLAVFREHADFVQNLLQVLEHDPLYHWTVPGGDASHSDVGHIGCPEARRALLGVNAKCQSPLSVECQVNELIQMATDPTRLCAMFPGWQSWL